MAIETRQYIPKSEEARNFQHQFLSPEKRRMFEHQDEVVRSLEKPFFESLLNKITPVEKIWQPSDILPNLESPDWEENLREFRKETDRLSDGFLAVLVFHSLTEEAIPAYMASFGRFPVVSDRTGVGQGPFEKFSRWWTAEEKRHGDFDRGVLLLSGGVKMKAYERTEMSLIRNGFDTGIEPGDTYGIICYPSDQEEKTAVATRRAGDIAGREGSPTIQRGLYYTASDETRHKKVYQPLMGKIFEHDPNGATLAFRRTQIQEGRKAILMPAGRVTRGEDVQFGPTRLFGNLFRIELAMGGYTLEDDAEILGNLIKLWDIEHLPLNDEADKAREEIMNLYEEKKAAVADFDPRFLTGTVRLPYFDNPIPLRRAA